jgi:BirA family transcriptional regulator, biotin operon repressor / biotin---[acetyl-CoA-carboxylase] ligase
MLRQLHLDHCDSTQDVLERHVEECPDDHWLISTNFQKSGRGRGEKKWEHLSGALAFSFNAPAHPRGTWQSLEVAVVVARWLATKDCSVTLKWPNDLYSGGRKCGGILLKGYQGQMLIGVGLNLRPSPDWGHASVSTECIADFQRSFPREIAELYSSVSPLDTDLIRREWEARCLHWQKTVEVNEGEAVVTGRFLSLGVHGEAVIETSAGIESVFNGTLWWSD